MINFFQHFVLLGRVRRYLYLHKVLRCRLQRNTGGAFRSWEVRLAVGRCVSQLGGACRNFYLQSRPAHLTWVWSALIEIYSFYAINLGPFPGPS